MKNRMRVVWVSGTLTVSAVLAASSAVAGTFTVLHTQNAGD